MILALSLLAPTPWLVKWRSNPKKMLILPQDNSAKVYPHFVQQAYQADVLLRRVLISSVGTRYPHKDQVEITVENTYQHSTNALYSFSHRIDVVVKCENRVEAVKLNTAIREYLVKNLMLPLHVGVFQKPFTKDTKKPVSTSLTPISTLKSLETLPKLEKDKSLKFVLGASPIESNVLANGFDLEHTFMSVKDAKKNKIDLQKDIYKLSLYTSTTF